MGTLDVEPVFHRAIAHFLKIDKKKLSKTDEYIGLVRVLI